MRVTLLSLFVAVAASHAAAAEQVDLQQIGRMINKQPSYTAQKPLYGLAVFGPKAEMRVWLVLDKSKRDAKHYDILYADMNGNNDLTEKSERFSSKPDSFGRITFQLPDFTDPTSKATHTEFKVTANSRATHMVSVLWRGKHKFGGGYPVDPQNGYMRFAESATSAPIAWLNGDGPFRFQRWFSGELRVGGASDFKVFLGLPGVGNGSFCAFQRYVLPEGEPVLATLVYTDREGNERTTPKLKLKERC